MEILKRHSRIKQRRERPKKGLKTKQNENKKPFGVQSRKIADMNVNFSLPANEIQVHKKNSLKFTQKIASRFSISSFRHANSPWDNSTHSLLSHAIAFSSHSNKEFCTSPTGWNRNVKTRRNRFWVVFVTRLSLLGAACVCMWRGWSVCCQYMPVVFGLIESDIEKREERISRGRLCLFLKINFESFCSEIWNFSSIFSKIY